MLMGDVPLLVEGKRGCGYRKGGGKYLVADAETVTACGKLPLELTVCPTCRRGVKPTRGWTWVDAKELFADVKCEVEQAAPYHECPCPLETHNLDVEEPVRMGLLWVGEKYYADPKAWLDEALKMGVSRKIQGVPHDFVLGETWVLLAHRKALSDDCVECGGGGKVADVVDGATVGEVPCGECDATGRVYASAIFHAFKPTRIEYVCTGKETEAELDKLVKRGITPVRVKPVDEDGKQVELPGLSDPRPNTVVSRLVRKLRGVR